ncbi:hypothetical protein SSX86_012475 [Deinandra increscens subsp. villosa]|uniref:Uncharacterized protein n=1 Tax=Deinandra increscens subsp. villosa TaxID=3103831 RepID=A0AAP0D8T1_9ASTR
MNKSVAETDTLTTEESGWTAYFEDFMVAQQQDQQNHTNSFPHHHDHYNQDHHNHHHQQLDGPELSDVASHVDWNSIANTRSGGATLKFPKKLNFFKKTSRRTREILFDDSLEDTASSPVNSPKVGSPHMGFDHIKFDDTLENSLQDKGGFHGGLQPQKLDDQISRPTRFEENNNGDTDLRKRGLCLVPLSMLVNYIR